MILSVPSLAFYPHCTDMLYYFPRTAITKSHELCSLQQQKFFMSQSWRREVSDQGANRVILLPIGEKVFDTFLLSFWW